jgi:hypothetical protein
MHKERRTQLPQYESNKTERISHIDQSVIDFELNHVWIGVGQVKPPFVRVIMGKNSSHCFLLKQKSAIRRSDNVLLEYCQP